MRAVRRQDREQRASGAASNFEPGERGDAEEKKYQKEHEEVRIDSKNGGSQNAGKRQHRQEKRVAIGGRAVKANNRDEQQKVNRSHKRGIESGVRGSGSEIARKENRVDGEEEEVSDNQPRGRNLAQLGRKTTPPAQSLVEHKHRRDDGRQQVQLAGSRQRND